MRFDLLKEGKYGNLLLTIAVSSPDTYSFSKPELVVTIVCVSSQKHVTDYNWYGNIQFTGMSNIPVSWIWQCFTLGSRRWSHRRSSSYNTYFNFKPFSSKIYTLLQFDLFMFAFCELVILTYIVNINNSTYMLYRETEYGITDYDTKKLDTSYV